MSHPIEDVLTGRPGPRHVCWSVGDGRTLHETVRHVIGSARDENEQPVVFGPEDGDLIASFAGEAEVAFDPAVRALSNGPLRPESMLAMFRDLTSQARTKGYRGIRLVADMDWLRTVDCSREDIVAFELLLDRAVGELDATVCCAYRQTTFDRETLLGAMCVHRYSVPSRVLPFRMHATSRGHVWKLVGEIDASVANIFEVALVSAARTGVCEIDASELAFIDIAGVRTLADASRRFEVPIVIRQAPSVLRRCWELSGMGSDAPLVQLVA